MQQRPQTAADMLDLGDATDSALEVIVLLISAHFHWESGVLQCFYDPLDSELIAADFASYSQEENDVRIRPDK
jgi:hypothetical protein